MSWYDERCDRWDAECQKVRGKVPGRVENLLARVYLFGGVTKPLEELTNEELMHFKGFGLQSLDAVRKVIPLP